MTTDLKMTLGAKVRAAREIRGLSQEQLAEAIGRTPETISNIERGKTMPGTGTLHALCAALSVEWTDLLSELETRSSADRIGTEFRILQMVRALPQEDLEIVEKTAEALFKRIARPPAGGQ
jgi:transcriptional regulator with XRE-family HTH domain